MRASLRFLKIILIATVSCAAVAQQATDQDVVVFADALRKVKIVYTASEYTLGRCEVKLGKDARVVDQMMCSILANCVAAGWSGMDRATKCVNSRVDEVEQAAALGTIPRGSALPDEWLTAGDERPITEQGSDVVLTGAGAGITPGEWVFTELMVGRNDKGMSQPYMLRWHKCIAPGAHGDNLSRLLEPLPLTARLRSSLPDQCRRWNVKADGSALSGDMACKVPSGAKSSGSLKGRYAPTQIVLHRQRRWERPSGWAEATFDTRGVHSGACSS